MADTVFLYSSVNQIYGVNIDSGDEVFITSASLSPTVNALAVNDTQGLIYYGDDTSIYYWDSALGTGPGSHALINNFENGFFQAPIHNINSTGGSYLNGFYYIGSEDDNGFIEELYELRMSADGRQIVSMRELNLQDACNCSQFQLGGFGDIAVLDSLNGPVIYGSSTDLTNAGLGTHAGIWRFELATSNWTLLANGVGGQLAASLDGRMFTNVGRDIRELNTVTGAVSSQTLFSTDSNIWDFTGGFSFDFGDAPDSYGAASHLVGGQNNFVFIGQTPPDNESFSQHSGVGGVDGLGDDNTGVDDEDALSTTPQLNVGDTDFSLDLQCSSGYVAAWIDFNLNGQFDFNERNTQHPVSCNAGIAQLNWTGFSIAGAGTAYIRIRSAADGGEIYRPTGIAASGEVEDFRVVFVDDTAASGNCPAGSVSHIFNSTDVPKTYSGRMANTSVITVPDSLIITDLNLLNWNATHLTQRRLYFNLRKGGTRRRLFGNTCTANQGFTLNFDDQAVSSMPCPPVAGAYYRPQQSLSVFNGDDAQGDWLLEVWNFERSNRGRINSWALEVCAVGVVDEEPDLRLGKIAEVDGRVVTVTLLARNTGDTALNNVVLVDNLDAVFGIDNYSLLATPEILTAPAGFTINASYTGQSGFDSLLNSSSTLAAGEEISVRFSVDVAYADNNGNSNYSNQAVVTGLTQAGEIIEDLSSTGLDLSVDADVPTPIALSNVVSVSGVVFHDTSADASTSHDGIQAQSEQGEAGRVVSVIDTATGIQIATSVTAADGSWSTSLDASYVNQPVEIILAPVSTQQVISESPLNTDSANADGKVTLLVQADANLNTVDFGIIDRPSLLLDNSRNIAPGESTLYEHTYTVPTHGLLQVDLTGSSSSPSAQWSYSVHHDVNCDRQLGSTDVEIVSDLNVTYEQVVCLLVEVGASSSAVSGDSVSVDLNTNLLPIDPALISHNINIELSNQDITRILASEAGNLVLEKSVSNITKGEQPVNDQNRALPGHVLEYSINYVNTGNGNINNLVINDESPAFTQIDASSVQCAQTPAPLTCAPALNGSQLQWNFSGSLSPGEGGQVRYRVRVD